MKKFEIVIEDTRTVLKSRVFKAKSLDDAIRKAEATKWNIEPVRPTKRHGWEEYKIHTSCAIRTDLCHELTEQEN